jgi:hypothetical protein
VANGIDWLRWHHGSVNDPKFGLVAMKAGARVGDVIAVWALVLEQASANTDRGAFGDIDHEATDFLLRAEEGTTGRILAAMEERGLTKHGRVTRWDDRQPKRERVDTTAADRKRAQRDRERERDSQRDDGKDGVSSDVTPSHATSHQVTPREEKSREEKKEPKVKTNVACSPVGCADVARSIPSPERRKEPRTSQDVQDVFSHWQQVMNHPQARLDEKRAKAIGRRLADGYTVADLRRAVDGCRLTPHNMGQNDQRTVYDDIELICRDGPHVDRFIKTANATGIADPGLRRQIDVLQEWMEQP